MTEEDARLALLQTELNAIQNAIRGIDTIMFQVKGWCVTAALAIGGFAVAYHKSGLLVAGVGAVVGFYLVDCQFKMVQRAFIKRNLEIDSELREIGIMQVLKGSGNIDIVGTAAPQWSFTKGSFFTPGQATFPSPLGRGDDAKHVQPLPVHSRLPGSRDIDSPVALLGFPVFSVRLNPPGRGQGGSGAHKHQDPWL